MVATRNSDVVECVNRLELLLFGLGSQQLYGINVLKVKELLPCPKLTPVPGAHCGVIGIAPLRDQTISVVDLAMSIGHGVEFDDAYLIVIEINRATYGLLVERIDRITVMDWQEVKPPAPGLGSVSYMTGVCHIDGQLIQILDVERVIGEVGLSTHSGELNMDSLSEVADNALPVLIVDDSLMARNQTAKTLESIGLSYLMAKNGKQALDMLKQLVANDDAINQKVAMIISDIEMPEMDGYTLTREIRRDVRLAPLYVLLHSSLNGIMDNDLAVQVGANATLTKFVADDLVMEVQKGAQHA